MEENRHLKKKKTKMHNANTVEGKKLDKRKKKMNTIENCTVSYGLVGKASHVPRA